MAVQSGGVTPSINNIIIIIEKKNLPILCTYFDGKEFSSQHGKPGVD